VNPRVLRLRSSKANQNFGQHLEEQDSDTKGFPWYLRPAGRQKPHNTRKQSVMIERKLSHIVTLQAICLHESVFVADEIRSNDFRLTQFNRLCDRSPR
jgi:hypothetical protein